MQIERAYQISYNMLQLALLPVSPIAGIYLLSRRKYRKQLPSRLGFDLKKISTRRPRVWIHAMSVGELNAAKPLIHALSSRYQEAQIILSASTRTGVEALGRDFNELAGSCITTAFPYDLFFITRRFAKAISPDCFVLFETDIWPNILTALKKRGCRNILVNGSISSKAASRLSRLPGAARFLYGPFSFLGMQSNDDAQRLMRLGLNEKRIEAIGNTKFDIDAPTVDASERNALLKLTGFEKGSIIFCGGSTHEPEERILLRVFSSLKDRHPNLRLLLAPRNIERAPKIAEICNCLGLRFRLRSSQSPAENPDVFIVDTLGELLRFYSLGFVSFVGGTLAPIGGHNLLEPVYFGRPVLFGPNCESCREIACALEKNRAGRMVCDETELREALENLISDQQAYNLACGSASSFIRANRGVTKRYVDLIGRFLAND